MTSDSSDVDVGTLDIIYWRWKQFETGGTNSGSKRREMFLMCPALFSSAPPLQGHCWFVAQCNEKKIVDICYWDYHISNQNVHILQINYWFVSALTCTAPVIVLFPLLSFPPFQVFTYFCVILFVHGLLPGPFLLGYSVFVFIFPYFFRFCAVRYIKLPISSAFERTLIYRIVSFSRPA